MTSEKQFHANRQNAQKSTGPRTQEGKRRSRCNSVRHGLTAETVIGVLENPDDYAAFERAIIGDYAPQAVVEHELVSRLASLLWRLRRAGAIETGLFEIQGEILRERTSTASALPSEISIVYRLFGEQDRMATEAQVSIDSENDRPSGDGRITNCSAANSQGIMTSPRTDIARCFLRLANLNDGLLERIGRYESALWRQLAQTLLMLEMMRR